MEKRLSLSTCLCVVDGVAMTENTKKPGVVDTRCYSEAFRSWMHYQQWVQHWNIASRYYLTSAVYVSNYLKDFTVTPQAQITQITNVDQINNQPHRGRECEIPSLWRRLLAEIIDFCLLLLLKIGASLIVMDYIDFIEIDTYDIENFLSLNWDSKSAANFTADLIMIELTNRLCIAIFEALCLRGGTMGNIGGATPGKRIMGLRVVSCTEITKIDERRIAVYPGSNVTFARSFLRSATKNFSYLFFFPMPFTAIIFPFNRTAYDIFSGCVVVYIGTEYANNFREDA